MKKILLIALLALSATVSAQWETIDATDQFGDKTGETRNILRKTGVFSNSATRNSKASILIERHVKGVAFLLLDYNNRPNEYYKHMFDIHIKKNDGTKLFFQVAINTYSSYSGYTSKKWINIESYLKQFKPENWSEGRYGKHTKRHQKGGSYYSLQKKYDIMYNLEEGDILIIKEGSSTYKFIL